MKRLNYWPQWVKLCLLGPPRLPKKDLGSVGQPPLWGPYAPKWAPLSITSTFPSLSYWVTTMVTMMQSWIFEAKYWNFDYGYKSLEASKLQSFGRLCNHNFHHFPHHFHHYGQVGIKKTDRSPKTNDKQPGLPKNQKREDLNHPKQPIAW